MEGSVVVIPIETSNLSGMSVATNPFLTSNETWDWLGIASPSKFLPLINVIEGRVASKP